MGQLRVLLVGAGGFGRVHAEQIRATGGLVLAGYCDPGLGTDSLDGVRVWTDLSSALDEEAFDLVTICTPTKTHVELARTALQAGARVLVEKPLAATPGVARELLSDAERRGGWCDVVAQRRFQESAERLKHLLAGRALGSLATVNCTTAVWRGPDYFDSPWHGRRSEGGGNLLNHGMHAVDLLIWLFGSPIEQHGLTTPTRYQHADIEESCVGIIRFRDDVLATLEATLGAAPPQFRLEIRGDTGTAILTDRHLRVNNSDGSLRDEVHACDTDQALGRQYAAIERSVRQSGRPTVDVNSAVDAVDLAFALTAPMP